MMLFVLAWQCFMTALVHVLGIIKVEHIFAGVRGAKLITWAPMSFTWAGHSKGYLMRPSQTITF